MSLLGVLEFSALSLVLLFVYDASDTADWNRETLTENALVMDGHRKFIAVDSHEAVKVGDAYIKKQSP